MLASVKLSHWRCSRIDIS